MVYNESINNKENISADDLQKILDNNSVIIKLYNKRIEKEENKLTELKKTRTEYFYNSEIIIYNKIVHYLQNHKYFDYIETTDKNIKITYRYFIDEFGQLQRQKVSNNK